MSSTILLLTYLSALDCFTANYIIGVGLLGVPNAFAKAGLLFSPLILLGGSLISLLTIVWIVEVRNLYLNGVMRSDIEFRSN